MAERKSNTLSNAAADPGTDPEVCASVEIETHTPDQAAPVEALPNEVPSAVPSPGALIDGKYRVERLIARGGMGVVYAATHIVSGKKVALKWMLPALGQIKGARERFLQEACATARIAHPNIVDIYDVGGQHGSAYLVMEYLRGETLADRLCRQRLGVQDAVALLMPALRGVAAAHAHGVIHRDLKPENIFLCCTEHGEELEPKVLDFGISKITTDQVQSMALTHSGTVLGTPYYMSPEQVRGARDVDARADVYSLGVILFEALTGERPFEADTYNELILKIATAPMPNAAALNPALDARLIAVVERAMARDPDLRFPDVKELALALEPFGGGMRFRTMQTLNRQGTTTGGMVAPAVEPTRADTAPASLPIATSESELSPSTRPQPRGTRVAVAAAFLSLLSCAAVALYFINHPEERTTSTDEAKASGAQGEVHTANAPAEGHAEDTNAATAADSPAANAAPAENKAGEASTPTSASAPTKGIRTSAAPGSPHLQGKKAQTSNPNLTKRGQHSGRAAALASALESAATPPSAAPVVVRELPSDWEKRLDQHTDAPKAVHMPAGSIDLNDFR